MYACGVTVYDHCHIGHAMQAIFFDVIRNYLEFAGYKVTYVRNYTDVDDKIIVRAKERSMNPLALSQEIIESSQKDMEALGVRPATHEPKVSESIPQIIAMVETLVEKGHAYATSEGDVYYKVSQKADYGKLSNRKPDELRSGTRSVVKGEKRDELDFALWKKDLTEGASWESPWGPGRPGWHIECSAMAKDTLGDQFDIHGGGRDLVFPHHENEIAQSESANGCSYATHWLHSGLLTIDKQKMSKSLGNHISIQDFLKNWPSEVLRLAYLQQHYSSNVDFSQSVFQAAAKRLLFFYQTLSTLDQLGQNSQDPKNLLEGFDLAQDAELFHDNMANDFNTPCALRDLLAMTKKLNELKAKKKNKTLENTARQAAQVMRELFGVLGLLTKNPEQFITELTDKVLPTLQITESEIKAAIDDRHAARQNKDFKAADGIRDKLLERSIEIMDTAEGTKWAIKFTD